MDKKSTNIRIATRADLQDVQLCARAAYAKYIERMDKEPAPMFADFKQKIDLGQVYVAICGFSLAGYVVFYPVENHMHLENVAVFPSQSGQGIGKMLVKFVEQVARNKGFDAVELYTNEAMTENLSMYPMLGYVETHRMQQEGFNRVFFRKSI